MEEPGETADCHGMARLGDVVAAAVRAERARRRWTQQELATRVGWSVSTLGDLEAGRRRVTADDLPLLCGAFSIDFAELVRGADEQDLSALGILRRLK